MPDRKKPDEFCLDTDVYDADDADREFDEIVRKAVEEAHDRLTGEDIAETVISKALRRWRGEEE